MFFNNDIFFQWCMGEIPRLWGHKWWLGQPSQGGETKTGSVQRGED